MQRMGGRPILGPWCCSCHCCSCDIYIRIMTKVTTFSEGVLVTECDVSVSEKFGVKKRPVSVSEKFGIEISIGFGIKKIGMGRKFRFGFGQILGILGDVLV